MKTLSIVFSFLIVVSCASDGYTKTYYDRKDVQQFVQRMVKRHQFDKDHLRLLFERATVQNSVLQAIQTPAERKKKWFEYRPIFLTEDRINGGIEYWRNNRQVLEEVKHQYGVPEEIIVAIIGVETFYGRLTGRYPVFDSLVTLGFDYPPRSAFFLDELEQYLLLCREEGFDPGSLLGSYAGAMGRSQFISSSYRRYAVDQNGDGKRDLWVTDGDAIASVANYLKNHGWKQNHVIATSARFSGNVNKVDMSNQLKPTFTYNELSQLGFVANSPVGGHEVLSLIVLDGNNGKEFWLGHNNFYVITRYNHSAMYAMAVFQLSQEIKHRIILNASGTQPG